MQKRTVTVQQIYDWLDDTAPFDSQEEFDNAGLQLGRLDAQVNGVLLALDVTEEVIQEAVERKADLIITHHPLIFSPIKSLNLADHVPRLIELLLKHEVSLISTHTNIDQSPQYSASAEMTRRLGLLNVRQEGPYLFIGDLPQAVRADYLADTIKKALGTSPRLYGDPQQQISTLAVAGGAYSEGYHEARSLGAQALLTGEVKHHHALEATAAGMVIYDGGHYATEAPMLEPLAFGLQKAMNQLEYSVQVYVSRCVSYRLQ